MANVTIAQQGVVNTPELLERLKQTEDDYNQRQPERDRADEARDQGRPLDAEETGRRNKRYANVGQQPISPAEMNLAFERILGTNDLVGVTFVERMLRAIAATGRIVIRLPDGRGGYGTGFLVAPGILLTNNHVLSSETIASLSRIQFDYEERDGGVLTDPVEFQLRPDLFFVTNVPLDYTFVAVRDVSEKGERLARYGFVPLIESEGKVAINEAMNIVQHPSGERKRLSIRENRLVDVLPDVLHYQSDTSPGSSGSPVFSDMWEVVALHHAGVPVRNSAGRILTRAKTEWRPEMGEDAIHWKANAGVRVSRILATLRAAPLDPSREDLRRLVLSANTLRIESLLSRPDVLVPARPDAPSGSPIINPDGSATWTLPLVVTLNLGGVGHAPAAATPKPQIPAIPTPTIPAAPRTAAPEPKAEPNRELNDALAEFERGRADPYYDEAADRADRDRYYSGLNVTRNRPPPVADLSALLDSTHTTKVRYDSGRSVYVKADLHPDGLLRSIYSGVTFDPREAIREVVMLDQQVKAIEAQIAEGRSTESAGLHEIDLLEAASPFNCEHVVPQSWFGKDEPMRGDMHHLFACGSRCNSFRGNTPYYDFPDFEEAVMDDCGKREKVRELVSGFEPNRGKGAAARATLYFLVRYPNMIAPTSFPAERIKILTAWSKNAAPDEYERHRNRTIFQRQGNRNPFIDFPEWVKSIRFEALLAADDEGEEPAEDERVMRPPVLRGRRR